MGTAGGAMAGTRAPGRVRAVAVVVALTMLATVLAWLPGAAPAAAVDTMSTGVTGTITGPSGPAEGVRVDAFVVGEPHDLPAATATSSATGAYSLALDEGSYQLEVTPPKADPQQLASTVLFVDVVDGEVATADIPLPVGNVRGTVHDARGAVAVGARVEAIRDGASPVWATTYDDGTYRLAMNAAGDYTVTAFPPAENPSLDAPVSRTVTVATEGETRPAEDFTLAAPTVVGTITSPDGTVNIGAAHIVVTTSGGGAVAGGTMTARSDGRYGFALPEGTYTVKATPPAPNDGQWVFGTAPITVTADHTGDAPLVANVALREPILKGVVRTPAGEPVPYASVHGAHQDQTQLPIYFGTADAQGRYLIDLPAGRIWVFAYRPAPSIEYIDIDEHVTVTEPTVRDVVFPATNVRGVVTDPDGGPAAGASIEIYTGSTSVYAPGSQMPDGTFGVRVDTPGDYRIVAFPPEDNPERWGRTSVPVTIADVDVVIDGISIALGPTAAAPFDLSLFAPFVQDGWDIEPIGPVALAEDGSAAIFEARVSPEGPDDTGGECCWATGFRAAGWPSAPVVDDTPVIWDRATGRVEPIPTVDGAFPDRSIYNRPAISSDGRYVAFWSDSTNLVTNDQAWGVFVHDRVTGATVNIPQRLDEWGDEIDVPNHDEQVTISDDGRTVAFVSERYEDSIGYYAREVELVHLDAGFTAVESREIVGGLHGARPVLSNDGTLLAWLKYDWDTETWTAEVRDLTTGIEDEPRFVYGPPYAGDWNAYDLASPALDGDGSTLVYPTWEFVPAPPGGYNREVASVRVADRLAGTDEALPLFDSIPQSDGVTQIDVSADGNIVMAVSASDLPEDGDRQQLWIYDRTTGERTLVSQNGEREPADRGVDRASMTGDGESFFIEHDSGNLGGTAIDDYGPFIHVARVTETNPPTWPVGSALSLVGDAGATGVQLEWTPATDDRSVLGYRLYQDGAPVAEVRNGTTAFVTGLSPETSYLFKVEAFDPAGNQSTDGPSLEVTTAASGAALEPLSATTAPGGKATLSWPSAAGIEGITGLLVRSSVDGVTVDETELPSSATTHTMSGLPAATTVTFQVFAVKGTSTVAYTTSSDVTIAPLSLTTVDFGAPLVRTGLARLGSDATLVARGEPGRHASATVVYKSWYGDDMSLLSAPVERQALVSLTEDAAAPGTYRGAFALNEGTAELTRVDVKLSDGHDVAHDVTRSSTRAALPVSGAIVATVDAPAGSLPDAVVQFASATSGQASTNDISGGAVVNFPALVPAADAAVTVLDADGREAARAGVSVVNGRVSEVTLVPTLPASLTVTVNGEDGLAAPGARVEARSTDGTTFFGSGTTDGDGVVTLPRLIAGVPLTVSAKGPLGGILGSAELTDVELTFGANERTIALPTPTRVALSGVIRNAGGDVSPATKVVVTQQYLGTAQTFSTTTGDDGSYELLVLPGAASLFASTLSQRAYRAITLTEGVPSVEDLQLAGVTSYVVKPRIYTTYVGAPEEGPIGFDWRTAVHMSAAMSVAGRSVSPNGLTLGADNLPEITVGGLPGDEFRLCIDGRREAGLEYKCGTIVLGEDSAPVLEMHLGGVPIARGRFLVEGTAVTPQARLFQVTNAGEAHVSTGLWGASGLALPGLGNYVAELAWGEARATVAFFSNETGPDLGSVNLTVGGLFSSPENQVIPMRRDITPGSDVEFRASWHNNGDAPATGASALILVPAGTEVLAGSITLNGTPVATTTESGDHRVALGTIPANGSGSLRYRVRTTEATPSSIAGRVRLDFTSEGSSGSRDLVPAIVQVVGLTFDAPAIADGRRFPISGRATPGAVVTIREAGALLAEATASPGGFWSTLVDVPAFGTDDEHLLSATAVAGEETVTIERSVIVDSSRPVVENVSIYQIDPQYGTGRRSDFDPREGVARFPFTWVPSQPTIIELTFDDPSRVTVANVNVGSAAPIAATDADGDGVFKASLPSGWYDAPRGALFVEVDGHPEPIDLGTLAPTKAEVDARIPWYLNGYEVVTSSASAMREALATTGEATGSVTIKVPELGADAEATLTMTVSEGTYVPTTGDIASAQASGSPVYGLSFARTGQWSFSTSAIIPLEELEGADPPDGGWTEGGPPSGGASSGFRAASAAGAATQAARVGYQWAFNGVTAGDSAWSAWNADEKYKKLEQALDAATECGASAGPYLDRAQELAYWSAAADVGGAVLQVGSLFLAPATFGLGTIALGVLGWAVDKATGYAIEQATDQLLSDIKADADCEDDEDDDDDNDDDDDDDDDDDPRRPKKRKVGDPTWIYDPSGYVYEGVPSRRIEGVTATLLNGPTSDGPWTVWDASWFGQQNPLVTDHLGKYAWDVPEGWWKVAFTKDGYEVAYSDALEVLPPHFDVNISMRAIGFPDVDTLTLADDGSLVLAFTRPMRVATALAEGALTADVDGTWEAIAPEVGAGGADLAAAYRFVPSAPFDEGATVEVTVAPVVADYGDRVLRAPATKRVTVPVADDGSGGGDGDGGDGDGGSGSGDGDGDAGSGSADGYRLVGADGGVFSYGGASFHGSTGGMRLNQPVIAAAATPSGKGYWLVGADGGVFTFGDAGFFGSTGAMRLNQPIIAMAATPSGKGYWLVAKDGGVFTFGDARFFGSTGAMRLNQPIVGTAPAPDGKGYWLVARDGGVFAFGSAAFRGSTGAMRLNAPIVAMAAAPDGGYWLVGSDGGIFAFGAPFLGSAGALRLSAPIVGASASSAVTGYRLFAADGGVFTFGAPFFGSAGGTRLNAPVVAGM